MKTFYYVEVSSFRKKDMQFVGSLLNCIYDKKEAAEEAYKNYNLSLDRPTQNEFVEKFLYTCAIDEDDIDFAFPCDITNKKTVDFELLDCLESERYAENTDNEDD